MSRIVKIFLLIILAAVLGVPSAEAAKTPTLKMLSTTTCPACKQMSKVLEEIDAKYSGKLATEHINLEDNPDIARRYNVRYVPTLIFVDAQGVEVAQEVGYRTLPQVLDIFRKAGVSIQ